MSLDLILGGIIVILLSFWLRSSSNKKERERRSKAIRAILKHKETNPTLARIAEAIALGDKRSLKQTIEKELDADA